VKQQDR
jgi:hypothetical protein